MRIVRVQEHARLGLEAGNMGSTSVGMDDLHNQRSWAAAAFDMADLRSQRSWAAAAAVVSVLAAAGRTHGGRCRIPARAAGLMTLYQET